MREQIVNASGGVSLDSYEHIAQVGGRIDAVRFARRDERIETCNVVAAVLRTDNQTVFPSEGDTVQGARSFVVWVDVGVVEEARERLPVAERIADGLARRALGNVVGFCSSDLTALAEEVLAWGLALSPVMT